MPETERDDFLKGLEEALENWDHMFYLSRNGTMTAFALNAAFVLRACLASPAPLFKKVVLGLTAARYPWAVWAGKALELNTGIEIDRLLLLFSGVAVALGLIDSVVGFCDHRAWERLQDERDALGRPNGPEEGE